jgi:hypothetical protein
MATRTYLEYYKIGLSINDKSYNLDPTYFSFSMRDNIYNLYNTGTLLLKDKTGLLQEYFETTEGAIVKIEYGNSDYLNTCTFVNKFDQINETDNPGFMTGEVFFHLIHEWYNEQQIRSSAYSNRISRIIRDLTNFYNFKNKDINDTGNERTWYQPMITDAKFIEEILLPNAFSRNADQTPFFAYITNDNVFHFRNFKSMLEENVLTTVNFKINLEKVARGEESLQDTTQSVQRVHQSSDSDFKLRRRNIFRIDRDTGEMDESEDELVNHYPQNNLKTSILHDRENTTDYFLVGFTQEETGDKESQLGRIFYSHRDALFLDKFIFFQPFNPKLKAGGAIQLNIYSTIDEKGNKLSKHFSGRYVIIDCEHIWDAESQKGYTKLIVGKRYNQVPEAYLLKSDLL